MRILVLAAMLLLVSCSSKFQYFTNDLYRSGGWSEQELKRIQFYVSQDIVLQRRLRREDSRITDGKIRIIDGSEAEVVVIKRGTPGVVVGSISDNKLAVSFEQGSSSKSLVFGPGSSSGGRYVLLAKDWNRNMGKVSYGNQEYEVTSSSAIAALKVDIKKARNTKVKSERASGARVRG